MDKAQRWIWQHPGYPHFQYDQQTLSQALLQVSKKQGELEGSIKHLSSQEKENIFTENILDEIIYNASIEGEILQRASVRASIVRILNENYSSLTWEERYLIKRLQTWR